MRSFSHFREKFFTFKIISLKIFTFSTFRFCFFTFRLKFYSNQLFKKIINERLCADKTTLTLYMICSSNARRLTLLFSKGVSENILQRNLFIILESSEMIAQLRLCSIFFLTIIVPMHWLASNTFKLSHRQWREKSMGRVIDLVYDEFV